MFYSEETTEGDNRKPDLIPLKFVVEEANRNDVHKEKNTNIQATRGNNGKILLGTGSGDHADQPTQPATTSSHTDGDFTVLYQLQKKWAEEREETLPIVVETKTTVPDKSSSAIVSRPSKLNKKDVEKQELSLALFTAVENDDTQTLTDVLKKIYRKGYSLIDEHFLHSENQATILHHALISDIPHLSSLKLLLPYSTEDVLTAKFTVRVGDKIGTRTVLHQLAEHGDISLTKGVCSRIKTKTILDAFLRETTSFVMEGQRPRQLMAIHMAAFYGHDAQISYFMELGLSANIQNSKQDTPLLVATRGNQISTCKLLLQNGANVNQQNDKGSSSLHWAVRYNLYEMAEMLIVQGKANVNIKRKLGLVAPLILASACGFTNQVSLLLKHGASVDLSIRGGETALHHACQNGHLDIVKKLLEYGAHKEAIDEQGNRAILIAAKYNHPEIVLYLAQQNCDLTQGNREGVTLWHHAIDCSDNRLLTSMVQYARTQASFYIHGAADDSLLQFPPGKTPFHIAAGLGDADKISALLKLRVDPDVKDAIGNQYLHTAAIHSRSNVIQKFAKSSNVNAVNDEGNTVFHVACLNGDQETINHLLPVAHLNLQNNIGETPLHILTKSLTVLPETLKLLINTSIKNHDWAVIDTKDVKGNTALHNAMKIGRPEIIAECGDMNIRLTNNDGNSPLHVLLLHGNMNALITAIDVFTKPGQHLDLNQKNFRGETLLHIASSFHNKLAISILIENGADLACIDKEGNNVLHKLAELSLNDYDESVKVIPNLQHIAEKSIRWWCLRKGMSYPEDNMEEKREYKRNAMLLLTSEATNKQKHTVISYAASLGATQFLEALINMKDVYCFDEGKHIRYDVTGFTSDLLMNKQPQRKPSVRKISPTSLDSKIYTAEVGNSDDSFDQNEQMPLMEHIIGIEPLRNGAEILDITPFFEMVSNYWSAYQWLYGLTMIIHILYMGLFSAYAIPLLPKVYNQTTGEVLSVGDTYLWPYILFLIYPIAFILFDLYYVILEIINTKYRKCCNCNCSFEGFFSSLLKGLYTYSGTLFAVPIIAWFIALTTNNSNLDIVLSVCLIWGWLYTIVFTRGFSSVHHISLMIWYMLSRDIGRFLLMYFFVLMAFAFGFHALIQIYVDLSSKYPHSLDTMYYTFQLMVGMNDFFDDDLEKGVDILGSGTVTFIKLLFVLYIIIGTIILLNLLIAMMNDSYSHVEKHQAWTWRVGSIRMALLLEKRIPFLPKLVKHMHLRKSVASFNAPENRYFISIPKGSRRGNSNHDNDEAEGHIVLEKLEKKLHKMSEVQDTLNNKLDLLLRTSGHQVVIQRWKNLSNK